ncbi:uncharacterized protein [Diabrotica undecimpunctata]|uniref:uncharacterized protein n=1 Tax=Diabrotica undecimpunctata TaxID=50387 RepID=UPI003B640B80
MRCAVACCNNDNEDKDKIFRFHTFPKDSVTRKLWIISCCRQDKFNCNTARICSKHFKTEDYQRNLQQELLNYVSKKGLKLKPEAVPSLHLPKSKSASLSNNKKKKVQRAKHRASKKCVEKLLTTSRSTTQVKVQAQEGNCSQLNIEDVPSTSKSIGVNTDPTNETLELVNSKKKIKLLKEQVAELLQIKSAVEKLFTPRQLKHLQNPKIPTVWSVEELSQAISLYSAGTKTYRLLLKKGYPLPAISTLKAWTKNN